MNDVSLEIVLNEARIARVLVRYATVLDERNWEGLHDVFASNATAHYHGVGEFSGRAAVTSIIRDFLDRCGSTQHMVSNIRVVVEGVQATAKCYLQAVHAGKGDFEGRTMTVWGEYSDRLELRAEGWRIVRRELAIQHVTGDVGVTLKAST